MVIPEDEPNLWAYLRVTSHQIQSGDIAAALGIEPDESHDIGDPNPYREGGRYKWSMWTMNLDLDDSISLGTEGLWQAVEALSDELASRLGELARSSCEVTLMLVQGLDEASDSGIHLTAKAIDWLARAGVSLDIDQYVWADEGGRGAGIGDN